MSFLAEALRKPTARAVVEAIFSGFVRMQRDRDKARGCLIVSGALAAGEPAETVRQELAQLKQAIVKTLRERFKRAVQDGDLPTGTDCATLARYTATVLGGLAVQAASGATEKELQKPRSSQILPSGASLCELIATPRSSGASLSGSSAVALQKRQPNSATAWPPPKVEPKTDEYPQPRIEKMIALSTSNFVQFLRVTLPVPPATH